MALRVRDGYYNARTRIDTRRLVPTSRLLSRITGMTVQRNKAVVGQNAFAHEAGIHQHGMLKHRGTYEIMRPEDVGWIQSQMVLGRHRTEEHTSELQSLMRISYAVFCLKQKTTNISDYALNTQHDNKH